jgi:hypothetical protein
MAPAIFITGSQSGVVDSATSTSPGELLRAGDDTHRAAGDLLADRAAGRQNGAGRFK